MFCVDFKAPFRVEWLYWVCGWWPLSSPLFQFSDSARYLLAVIFINIKYNHIITAILLMQYEIQYPGTWCFLNLHPENPIDAAYSVTFAVLNLLLIGVMIICNIGVQCKYNWRHCITIRPQKFVLIWIIGSFPLSLIAFFATKRRITYKISKKFWPTNCLYIDSTKEEV